MSSQICNSTSGLLALVTDPPQVIVTKYLIIWCQWTGWSLHPTAVQEIQETCVQSWVKKIPWRREWQPTPVFVPGKSHERRSLAGCSPQHRKESDTAEHTCTWRHMSSCRPSTVRAQMFLQGPLPCLTLCSQHSLLWTWLAALSHPHFMSTAFQSFPQQICYGVSTAVGAQGTTYREQKRKSCPTPASSRFYFNHKICSLFLIRSLTGIAHIW